ncbi:hypothetical protein NW762_012906 [Fusarium torreyae]|uniref:Uncharacterized protein n=1 Tax=Fusarium torreyae TaxID=1237075 RepID=A0A9W8RQE5_9HYPO|nr:hypothetical protein NW762_012906 [Fusarium torreyae]
MSLPPDLPPDPLWNLLHLHAKKIRELDAKWNGPAWLPEDVRRAQKGTRGGTVVQQPPKLLCAALIKITDMVLKHITPNQLPGLWSDGGRLRQAVQENTEASTGRGSLTAPMANSILKEMESWPPEMWHTFKRHADTCISPSLQVPPQLNISTPSSKRRLPELQPIRGRTADATEFKKQRTDEYEHHSWAPRPISYSLPPAIQSYPRAGPRDSTALPRSRSILPKPPPSAVAPHPNNNNNEFVLFQNMHSSHTQHPIPPRPTPASSMQSRAFQTYNTPPNSMPIDPRLAMPHTSPPLATDTIISGPRPTDTFQRFPAMVLSRSVTPITGFNPWLGTPSYLVDTSSASLSSDLSKSPALSMAPSRPSTVATSRASFSPMAHTQSKQVPNPLSAITCGRSESMAKDLRNLDSLALRPRDHSQVVTEPAASIDEQSCAESEPHETYGNLNAADVVRVLQSPTEPIDEQMIDILYQATVAYCDRSHDVVVKRADWLAGIESSVGKEPPLQSQDQIASNLVVIPFFKDHWISLSLKTEGNGRHIITVYDPGPGNRDNRASSATLSLKKAYNLHRRIKQKIEEPPGLTALEPSQSAEAMLVGLRILLQDSVPQSTTRRQITFERNVLLDMLGSLSDDQLSCVPPTMHGLIRQVEVQLNVIRAEETKPVFDLKEVPKSASGIGSLLQENAGQIDIFRLAEDYNKADEDLTKIKSQRKQCHEELENLDKQEEEVLRKRHTAELCGVTLSSTQDATRRKEQLKALATKEKKSRDQLRAHEMKRKGLLLDHSKVQAQIGHLREVDKDEELLRANANERLAKEYLDGNSLTKLVAKSTE